MDFKSMLQHLSQLSEATKETSTGKVHKAEPGGYGRKFDPEEDGDDDKKGGKKEPAEKRGRGRPKKGADSETGQVAKYDNAKNLQSVMVGNLPGGKLPGKPGKKHSLKEWVEEVESKYAQDVSEAVRVMGRTGEGEPMQRLAKGAPGAAAHRAATASMVKQAKTAGSVLRKDSPVNVGSQGKYPSQQVMKYQSKDVEKKVTEATPGQQLTVKPMPGAAQLVDPASNKVMATGDAAAVKNIQGAVAQGKVQMRGSQEMAEGDDDYSAKKARAGKDIGKPGKQFSKIAKKAGEKYGSKERGEKVAGAVLAKLRSKTNEADIPSDQSDMGAGLGAGRNPKTFEGKKPDFLDLDDDKNKKEPMADAAKDAEKKKKKLKENAHRHSSAKLLGKAHALAKEAYNCKYDDLDEVKMYHEGFKEGLDECYGQGVYEAAPAMPPATMGGMSSQAMEADMDEGNAFTAALARTPPGGKFSVGGKSFTDRSGYDAPLEEFAFESFDKQLDALLNETSVSEGMSVSISKGQQGMPDSVSVTAQDGEADQLLSLIRQAGLGLFGGDDSSKGFSPEITGMSAGNEEEGRDSADIGVVNDHDDMMALIKKVLGGPSGEHEPEEIGSGSDEGHDHAGSEEGECNECGYMESKCQCDEEVMDEEESYGQEEEQVAEDNPPDSGAAETTADENAEAAEDQALATADELNELDQSTVQSYKDKADPWNRNKTGDSADALQRYNKGQDMANKRLQPKDDEQVTEWANDPGQSAEEFDEETFTTNEKFMTKTLAGGLNKQKSTGQTTVPVVASQLGRQVAYESVLDWKKLAGIK